MASLQRIWYMNNISARRCVTVIIPFVIRFRSVLRRPGACIDVTLENVEIFFFRYIRINIYSGLSIETTFFNIDSSPGKKNSIIIPGKFSRTQRVISECRIYRERSPVKNERERSWCWLLYFRAWHRDSKCNFSEISPAWNNAVVRSRTTVFVSDSGLFFVPPQKRIN